jgi:hypothetical protein
LRIIVNDPDKAEKVLKENDFTVSSTDVIAIGVPDKPGGLEMALRVLNEESIGIEYMYAFVGKTEEEALVILRVEALEEAADKLVKSGVNVLSSNKVYKL